VRLKSEIVNKQRPQSVLGALIRLQRKLAELPMPELAKIVGIPNPYLSQIERGLRAPSESVLESIAETLDISADELYRMAASSNGTLKPRRDAGNLPKFPRRECCPPYPHRMTPFERRPPMV
jgi:transcriptional regulator with XRE-family HTH domain